jgi:hypothetical protein
MSIDVFRYSEEEEKDRTIVFLQEKIEQLEIEVEASNKLDPIVAERITQKDEKIAELKERLTLAEKINTLMATSVISGDNPVPIDNWEHLELEKDMGKYIKKIIQHYRLEALEKRIAGLEAENEKSTV